MLRTRIFPINPGEEKQVVVRYQSVAPREGDWKIETFAGSREQVRQFIARRITATSTAVARQ